MSGLSTLFSWRGNSSPTAEIPDIFPFPYLERNFIETDVTTIYKRVLIDTAERTQGIKDELLPLLWDKCIAGESPDGLITMVSKAMFYKGELYLVYLPSVNVVRKATAEEERVIAEDYKTMATSKVGVYVSFKNYQLTDMLKIYSALEYCTIASLSKNMNLAKAIQIKVSELRSSVSLVDKADAVAQALAIATGLANGKDILTDVKDMIETAKPDITPTTAAMDFINQKRSLYLGLPAAWVTGLSNKGLGDSGLADAKAVERGLKNFFYSILKPVLEALFGIKVTFRSDDFEQVRASLEILKTFEITSEELLSQDSKQLIINKAFNLPDTAKGDKPKAIEVVPPVKVPAT